MATVATLSQASSLPDSASACPGRPHHGVARGELIPHRVRVRLAQSDRSTLLALVSTLHRRGVEVVAAEFGTVPGDTQAFAVTFLATHARAMTVAASLGSLVDVLNADLAHPEE